MFTAIVRPLARLLPTVFLLTACFPVLAQTSPAIDRVEEDWELVVASPSVMDAGPQITTTMSPEGDNSRTFFAFNVNYRDSPFLPGGLQVRCFFGDREITTPQTQKQACCQTDGELITWTQRLRVTGGVATYAITDGQSTTWGQFGQGDNLDISVTSTASNLNSYQPAVSIAGSGVSWQSNRVERMTLRRVRYFANNELIRTEEMATSVGATQ